MTQLQSLKVLLEREESERDAAAVALQQLQQQAQAAQAQAEQLVTYRGEYQQRWAGEFAQRGAIEIVHCYRSFADRLEQAITQQQRAADHAAGLVERARATLLDCEMRVASVRKLIERRIAEMTRAAERRDQKLTDEAAQRATWKGTPSRLSPLFP